MSEEVVQLMVVYSHIPINKIDIFSLSNQLFLLTSFVVVCCCPFGISDQKNPRHSGSSNIYGNKRVSNRTQLIATNENNQ